MAITIKTYLCMSGSGDARESAHVIDEAELNELAARRTFRFCIARHIDGETVDDLMRRLDIYDHPGMTWFV